MYFVLAFSFTKLWNIIVSRLFLCFGRHEWPTGTRLRLSFAPWVCYTFVINAVQMCVVQ